MKVNYDKETDVLYIQLNNSAIAESASDKPGIIIDYGVAGNIAGIEVLKASAKMEKPLKIEYEVM